MLNTWNIKDLKPFDKNSRQASEDDMARLRNQIQLLGQYKPLLITAEGIVLGGNHRLKIYQELGIEKVWVSVIEFIEQEGYWFANVNGEISQKAFSSQEAAMMEYALSDNDRAAHYLEDELLANIGDLELDENLFSVDLLDPTPLPDIHPQDEPESEPVAPAETKTDPTPDLEPPAEKYSITVSSTDQEKLENLKNKLVELGFEVSE